MAAPSKKPTKGSGKGEPPQQDTHNGVVGNNIHKAAAGELVPLNFKIDAELKKEFKTFATAHDLSMVDLLKNAFEFYKENKGG
tara:strand:- start:8481 stop:8729 length:249 start_codon:yes stop_codon:yes gene_type:complete